MAKPDKNIIITGANSFLGKRLVQKFLDNGYTVYGVVRNYDTMNYLKHDEFIPVQCDLTNIKLLPNKIDEKCETLIHLAWSGTRGTNRNDNLIQRKNYDYSMELVNMLKGFGVKTFVGAGTAAEYGTTAEVITENLTENPTNEYGIHKLKFTRDAMEYCKKNKIRFIMPRFMMLYGPNDYRETIVMETVNKMLKNENCDFTEATQIWNYLYIDDAVDAIFHLISQKKVEGIYNVASETSEPLKKYFETLKKLTKTKSKISYGTAMHANTSINLNCDISKLKSTGFTPKFSFEEGAKIVIATEKEKLGIK